MALSLCILGVLPQLRLCKPGTGAGEAHARDAGRSACVGSASIN